MAPNMGSAAPSRADHGRDHGQGTFRDHGQGEPTDTEPSITVIARSRSKRGAQAPRSRDNDRDRVPRITIAIDPVGTRSVKTGSYYYITVAIAPPLCAGCKPRKVLQKRKWGFGKNIRLGQDTLLSTDVIHLARRKAALTSENKKNNKKPYPRRNEVCTKGAPRGAGRERVLQRASAVFFRTTAATPPA